MNDSEKRVEGLRRAVSHLEWAVRQGASRRELMYRLANIYNAAVGVVDPEGTPPNIGLSLHWREWNKLNLPDGLTVLDWHPLGHDSPDMVTFEEFLTLREKATLVGVRRSGEWLNKESWWRASNGTTQPEEPEF